MIGAQLTAARGLLNWTVRDLAEKSGVHRYTVTNIETQRYSGDSETLAAIKRAIEKAGVEFINGKRPGVRLTSHK